MSAVILAVFNDFETAERVRVSLVRDGFPTDRVELTAPCELGRAACEPAASDIELTGYAKGRGLQIGAENVELGIRYRLPELDVLQHAYR